MEFLTLKFSNSPSTKISRVGVGKKRGQLYAKHFREWNFWNFGTRYINTLHYLFVREALVGNPLAVFGAVWLGLCGRRAATVNGTRRTRAAIW